MRARAHLLDLGFLKIGRERRLFFRRKNLLCHAEENLFLFHDVFGEELGIFSGRFSPAFACSSRFSLVLPGCRLPLGMAPSSR